MSNLVPLQKAANSLSNADFLTLMAKTELSQERVRPESIRLNGQTGKYEARKWNKELKVMEAEKYGDEQNEWRGVILMTRWFAKWKFGSMNQGMALKTREFGSFNESVELLEIDYTKGGSVSKGFYPDYKTFKSDHTVKDKLTGKESVPFDLWASLYILDLATGKVVNFLCKGQSRSNLFDYLSSYRVKLPDAIALAGVQTLLGIERHEMPGDASKEYFAASFKAEAILTSGEVEKVKESVMGLLAWMQSFKEEPAIDEEVHVEPTYEVYSESRNPMDVVLDREFGTDPQAPKHAIG